MPSNSTLLVIRVPHIINHPILKTAIRIPVQTRQKSSVSRIRIWAHWTVWRWFNRISSRIGRAFLVSPPVAQAHQTSSIKNALSST